jgi:hypothetical protein
MGKAESAWSGSEDGQILVVKDVPDISQRKQVVVPAEVPKNELVGMDAKLHQQVAANDEFFAPAVVSQEGKNVAVTESAPKEVAVIETAPKQEVAIFEEKQPPAQSISKREGKIRIGLVDATSLMESRVRDIADEDLTTEKGELHGVSGMFKKVWKYNLAQEYYRQKEMAIVRENILKSGTTFVDQKDMDRDKSAHQSAMRAIVERFVTEEEDMMHQGENRKVVGEDEKDSGQEVLKDLVLRYGKGDIQDAAAFQIEKQKIIEELKGSDANVKFADNLFAVAEQVRQAIDHGESVEALEKDMEIITGNARAGVRMEANLSSCDRLIEKLHSTRLGAMVNETTLALAVGAAWSVGVFAGTRLTSSKLAALASFGGTAALGAGVAAVRESGHMKHDRAIHTRDMAQGKVIDPENGKRRREMFESTYEMRGAKDLAAQMQSALFETDAEGKTVLRQNIGQAKINDTLKLLAEAEARIKLSDTRNIDLLSYTSAGEIEKERFELDLARAKTKVEVRKLLEANPEMLAQGGENINITPERYLKNYLTVHRRDIETSLGGEADKRDKIFEKMRRKHMGKAALAALGTGLLVGTVTQEVAAFATNQQGLIEEMVSGHHSTGSSETLAHYLLGGKMAEVPLHNAAIGAHHFKLPEGVSLTQNPDGSYGLLHGKDAIAQGLHFDKSGLLTPESKQVLGAAHIGLHDEAINITGANGAQLSPKEWMAQQNGATNVKRLDWFDNNTPSHFDKNELKLNWGGEHGTGINKDGNFVFDVKHMVAGGSHHGALSADAQQLAKEGKLEMIISASKDTQGQILKIPINADGTAVFDPKNPVLSKFFEIHDGRAVFVGKYAEVAEIVKSADADDAAEQIRILATHIGKDSMRNLAADGNITTINIPPDELIPTIPLVPISGRTPLEKMKQDEDEDRLEEKIPPQGDGMPAILEYPDPKFPPSGVAEKPNTSTGEVITESGGNNPAGDRVEQVIPPGNSPPRQEAIKDPYEGFSNVRKKYETDQEYYGRFQKFATEALGLPLDAPYDDIRKASIPWMRNNRDMTSDDASVAVRRMQKSMQELGRLHRADESLKKQLAENVTQETAPAEKSVELSEEAKAIQQKAEAIGKVWEKRQLALSDRKFAVGDINMIFQGLFNAAVKQERYTSEQTETLATALQEKEGIKVHKVRTLMGNTEWKVDVEDIDQAA